MRPTMRLRPGYIRAPHRHWRTMLPKDPSKNRSSKNLSLVKKIPSKNRSSKNLPLDYSLPEARSQGLDIGTVHLLSGLSQTPSASRTEGDNNPLTVQESFNGNMQDAGLFAVTSNISRADLEEDIDLRNSSYSIKGIRSDVSPVIGSSEQINRSPKDRRQNVRDIAYVKQNKNDEDFQTTVEGRYLRESGASDATFCSSVGIACSR